MNPDYVGYRFSSDELAALKLLMKIPSLPGWNPPDLDKNGFESVLASLVESNIVNRGDDRAYIERITALILSALAKANSYLSIESTTLIHVLSRSQSMYVLARYPIEGPCTLTPLQNGPSTLEPLELALAQHSVPFHIKIWKDNALLRQTTIQDKTDALAHTLDFHKLLCLS